MASVSSLSSVSSDMTPTNSLSELSLEFPAVSQDPSPITKGRSHVCYLFVCTFVNFVLSFSVFLLFTCRLFRLLNEIL